MTCAIKLSTIFFVNFTRFSSPEKLSETYEIKFRKKIIFFLVQLMRNSKFKLTSIKKNENVIDSPSMM
jgi:hypothetical protein